MGMRIYQPRSLIVGEMVSLDAKASHHVGRVLRSVVGEAITLFNGEGGEYEGVIRGIDKKSVNVELLKYLEGVPPPTIHIHLGQGLARLEKMDWIIQKAVELGVSAITPLITERSNVKLAGEREEKRLIHWQQVIVSACEQSGRTDVPVIHPPLTLSKWVAESKSDLAFLLSPKASQKLHDVSINPGAAVSLLIGPEGGLTDAEINQASLKNFIPLNLGPRILRTETAALAAITAIQLQLGDMG